MKVRQKKALKRYTGYLRVIVSLIIGGPPAGIIQVIFSWLAPSMKMTLLICLNNYNQPAILKKTII